MIQKIGDYFVCEGEVAPKNDEREQQNISTQNEMFEVKGNAKERLAMIRDRVQELKLAKQINLRENQANNSIFSNLMSEEVCSPVELEINISIPETFLLLEKRIEAIEAKIQPNELFRQKYQKKGTIVERVKTLQKQLQKLIEKRSPQITIQNIQTYCSHLDEKQEQMKPLFLYQTFTKTQSKYKIISGLGQELKTIESYVQNLSMIQTKIKSALPLEQMTKDHNNLVQKYQQVEIRIEKLFEYMKTEYLNVLKEIQQLE